MSDVGLVPLDSRFATVLREIRNEPGAAIWFVDPLPVSDLRQIEWMQTEATSSDSAYFGIEIQGNPAGLVGFRSIDWRNRSAEVIVALGANYRGRGFGAAAIAKLCEFGWSQLGLHRIWAEVVAGNDASGRAFVAAGFRREGVQRGRLWRLWEWQDMMMYARLPGDSEGAE